MLILVGNKSDLAPDPQSNVAEQLHQDQVHQLIRKHLITAYIKTSALTGNNINTLFEQLAGILDAVYPEPAFEVVPQEHPQTLSLIQRLAPRAPWFCHT